MVGILFILFFYLNIPFDPLKVLYGITYEFQFLPWLQEVKNNLDAGIYPFFSFEVNFGQDILAESQQAAAHPIKLLLLFVGCEAWFANSLFLTIHLLILYFGVFLFVKDYLSNFASFMLALIALLSTGIIINVTHIMLLTPLAYFPYLILLIKRFTEDCSFSKSALKLTLVTSLSLLCGHYQILWFTLFTLLLYSFFRSKESKTVLFYFLFSVASAFLICSFQLLPTIGQLVESSRSDLGSLENFRGSASPLTWLNYFSPTLGWEVLKFNENVAIMFGRHNLIENTHFLGTFPLIVLIAFLLGSSNSSDREGDKAISFLSLITLIKALGVFFFINILLNFLPVFGQFRIPARNLFLLDILILFFIATNLKNVSHKEILSSFKVVLLFIIVCTLISLIPIYYGFKSPYGGYLPFGIEDFIFIILPTATITVLYAIYKFFSAFLKINILVPIFFMITAIELAMIGSLMPHHHYQLTKTAFSDAQEKVDEFCENEIEGSKFVLGEEWPNFNKPIFWGKGSNLYYVGSEDLSQAFPLNGRECNINHSFIVATITPLWVNDLSELLFEFDLEERVWALEKFGYKLLSFKENKNSFSFEVNENIQYLSDRSDAENKLFNIIMTEKKDLLWKKAVAEKIYLIANKLGFENAFPTANISPFTLKNEFFLPIASTFSYVLLDHNNNYLPYDHTKRFLKLETKPDNLVKVKHIPVLFLIGLLISIVTIIFLVIVYFSCNPWKLGSPLSKIAEKMNLSGGFILLLEKSKFLLKKYEKLLNYSTLIMIALFLIMVPVAKVLVSEAKYDGYIDTLMMCMVFYFVFLSLLFYLLRQNKLVANVSLPIISFLALNLAFGNFIVLLGVTSLYDLLINSVLSSITNFL